MSPLDKFIVTQFVSRLPKKKYRKAYMSSVAKSITISREIERLMDALDRQYYLQELLDKRMK